MQNRAFYFILVGEETGNRIDKDERNMNYQESE